MSAGPDGRLGTTWPPPEVFRELAADRRVIPVTRRLLADGETPVGLYRKLARDALVLCHREIESVKTGKAVAVA